MGVREVERGREGQTETEGQRKTDRRTETETDMTDVQETIGF